MLSKIRGYIRNERGAEMVEWIVVVSVLALVASLVFGPNGVLQNAMNTGIQSIANTLTALPSS